MPANYHKKVSETISTRRSRLCIGLDPDISKFPTVLPWKSFNLKKNIEYFFKEIIYSTSEECCAYKPQAAMFSALGCEDLLVNNKLDKENFSVPDCTVVKRRYRYHCKALCH